MIRNFLSKLGFITRNEHEEIIKKLGSIEAAHKEEIKELKLKLDEAREESRGQHGNVTSLLSKIQNQLDAINETIKDSANNINEINARSVENMINALKTSADSINSVQKDNHNNLAGLATELINKNSDEIKNNVENIALKLSNVLEMLNIENTNVKEIINAVNAESADVKDVLKLVNDENADVKNLLKLASDGREDVRNAVKTITEESENVKNDIKNNVQNTINFKVNELKERIRLKPTREDIQKDVKATLAETEELLRLIAANQMMDFTERK